MNKYSTKEKKQRNLFSSDFEFYVIKKSRARSPNQPGIEDKH